MKPNQSTAEATNQPVDNWIHRSQNMQCRNCMWWQAAAADPLSPIGPQSIGRCRRHSPCQAVIGWPAVMATDWCGDHKLDKRY